MKLKARVRGVYSTAITRMLLDNRFEIVQPSLAIKQRFKFDENVGLPDLDIYDQRTRQGVHVVGTAESIGALRTILLDSLIDVICRRQTFPVDWVYKGTTKKEDGEEGTLSLWTSGR